MSLVAESSTPRLVVSLLVGAALLGAASGCGTWPTEPDDGHIGPVPPPPYYASTHECPAWSRLGLIAYRDNGVVWGDSTHWDIDWDLAGVWTVDPATGAAQLVVPWGDTPSWSADGLQLVLSRGTTLYTASPDGSGLESLSERYRGYAPSLSFDGNLVAWNGDRGTWVGGISGVGTTSVIRGAWDPDWHHEEYLFVCSARTDEAHGIAEASPFIQGGDLRFLHVADDNQTWADEPDYSPDGEHVAFALHRLGERPQVWLVDRAGSSSRQLTWGGGESPSWSPDGTKVVYAREVWRSPDPSDGVLWTVDIETGEQTQLTYRRTE